MSLLRLELIDRGLVKTSAVKTAIAGSNVEGAYWLVWSWVRQGLEPELKLSLDSCAAPLEAILTEGPKYRLGLTFPLTRYKLRP